MNDIDDQYRRASAQDPSQPSESTRRNILAHAAKLAAQRAAANDPVSADFRRAAANQPSWRPALIGTLAAAGLAGLLVTPLFLSPRAPQATLTATSPPTAAAKVTGEQMTESTREYSALQSAPMATSAPMAKVAPAAPATKHSIAEPRRSVADQARTADSSHLYSAVAPQYTAPANPAAGPSARAADNANQAASAQNAEVAPPAPLLQRNVAEPRAFSSARAGIADSARVKSGSSLDSSVGLAPAAALRQAAEAGDLSRLQALLAAPIDINARDAHGRTALMLATMHGQAGAVNALLAHGADVNVADANGLTPLRSALDGARPDIAAALERAGAR